MTTTTTTATTTRPAYRQPWTHGAKAYPQADTFDALRDGTKRKRKSLIVHMPNSGEAGDVLCATCGVALREKCPTSQLDKLDERSIWTVSPRSKTAYGQHYFCSWSSLFEQIASIRL